MVFEFLRLQFLRSVRSVSLSRDLAGGVLVGFFVFVVFLYVLGVAFSLKRIIETGFKSDDAIAFLNMHLLYLFVAEFMLRYFLQKLPLMELENFLHLPIKRSAIVHFLLGKSFISPLNIAFPVLLTPFAMSEVASIHGTLGAYSWLFTIILLSWSMHWGVLLFKVRFGDSIIGVLVVFCLAIIDAALKYIDWFHPGELLSPLFAVALDSVLPVFALIVIFLLLYKLSHRYYLNNAYLEGIEKGSADRYVNKSLGFLSRMGLSGEFADLEWKLILRHKKSRNYLFLSVLFLLYGVIFYSDSRYGSTGGIPYIYIFVGIFVTGVFMIQYGQLFLSWNSANFDFFLCRPSGAESLIKGKYLLFYLISTVCFLLSVPYVYYGWEVLLVHAVSYLFNIGVTIHLVVNLALWKPKPMDLNKGTFFNYEGVGVAQYLMILPMVIVPYLIFVPFSLIFNTYIGLLALAVTGVIGIIFNEKLTMIAVRRLITHRYEISTSFRQEL